MNRRHQTRAQRQAETNQRVIIGVTIVAILSVIALIAGAAYSVFVEPAQAMATINGQTITRQELYRRINYERFRIFKLEQSVRAQSLELLADPTSAQFFAQYVLQQQQQLLGQYGNLDFTVLETMIEERLIEEAATARGISVSDEEINTEIRRQIAQLQPELEIIPEDLDATATGVVNATSTAAAFTPTPEPTATEAAVVTETVEITATVVTTDSVTPVATATTAPATPTFAPTNTPNVFTEDEFQPLYSAFINEMQRETSFSEEDFRTVVRRQLFRQKLTELVREEADVSSVQATEEQIHAAHILVETQEEAQAVVDRLNAGEDFAEVAAEVSTDSSSQNGGDLGWFGRDVMVAEFENAAFALTEPGQISAPVQSQFGWHIIKLLEGPEQRPLGESDVEQAEATVRDEAWTSYLQELKSSYDIDRLWDGKTPADPGFRREMLVPYPTAVPAPTQPAATATVQGAPEAESPATDPTVAP